MLQPPNPLPLVDSSGRPLRLGAELGRGGEGSVFALADRADLVAKLYHHRPNEEKSAKIVAMAKLGSDRLLKLPASPPNPIPPTSPATPLPRFPIPPPPRPTPA